jgi:hypothetical protein
MTIITSKQDAKTYVKTYLSGWCKNADDETALAEIIWRNAAGSAITDRDVWNALITLMPKLAIENPDLYGFCI